MEQITYEDFNKLDMRMCTVLNAEEVEKSEKLIRFTLDDGSDIPRIILSGIKAWYPDVQALIGKTMLFVVNLEPRKMMGEESRGMLMAVDNKEGNPVFIVPENTVSAGVRAH
jgi:methionine--tRNA ligase beta chain